MIGRTLGPYRVIELVGTGGMGEVYRAVDDRLHREVAVKVLPAAGPVSPVSRERLRREAITASQINHPNIAGVYDIGHEGDLDYLVFEYVPGGTLADRMRVASLPLADVLRIGIEIAQGLDAAHHHGIVHRDLKATNVAFDAEGRAKILDFGIAAYDTASGAVPTGLAPTLGIGPVGTLPNMAPEQLRGESSDARTDLYALGVVLHEMATGQLPFSAANQALAIDEILHRVPPPIRSLDPALPKALDRLVGRLLAKKPAERPASASEVRTTLAAIQGTAAQPRPTFKRRRVVWGVAIVLAVASMVPLLPRRGLGFLHSFPGASAQRSSIVVFPLDILGGDGGSDYLGRAFAEAVTMNLAQTSGLDVLPASRKLLDEAADAAAVMEAGRKLGAKHAVSGSFLLQKDNLRATVYLIDVDQRRVAWGAEYDIDPADIGISASTLARELRSRLGLEARHVYEYFRYETGTSEMATWPRLAATIAALRSHDVPRGLALTESLLVQFPRVPEAHAMRLVVLVDQDNAGGGFGSKASRELSAGIDALEAVDPASPLVPIHRAMAEGSSPDVESRAGAHEKLVNQALARSDLSPGLRSLALRLRGRARMQMGKIDPARRDLEASIHQDPASPYGYIFLGGFLLEQKQYAEAVRRAREAAAIDPAMAGLYITYVLLEAGQSAEALAHTEELTRRQPSAQVWANLAVQRATLKRREAARAAIKSAGEFGPSATSAFDLARAAALLGDDSEALKTLDRAVQLGYRDAAIASTPEFQRFARDPRYLRLVKAAQPDTTMGRRS